MVKPFLRRSLWPGSVRSCERGLSYEHLPQQVWSGGGDADVRPKRTVKGTLLPRIGDDSGKPYLHLHRASRRQPDARVARGRRSDEANDDDVAS